MPMSNVSRRQRTELGLEVSRIHLVQTNTSTPVCLCSPCRLADPAVRLSLSQR